MPAEITMPQQSDTMTEGTLVKWNVSEGDEYKEGDVVAEIETDKATMEMDGPDEGGTVAAVLVPEGEAAAVGAVIAVIALEGEDAAEVKKQYAGGKKAASGGGEAKAEKKSDAARDPAEEPAGGKKGGASGGGSAGRSGDGTTREPAKPSYEGSGSDVTMTMPPAGGNGRHEGDSDGGGRIKASPLARRVAEQRGVDLSSLTGTGPGGRIVQKDVLDAAEQGNQEQPEPQKPAAPAAAPKAAPGGEVVELTKMRKTIAQRLQQSKQQIPHFYESIDIDMENAAAFRARANAALEKDGVRLSIGDVIAKAVAVALKRHPTLNAHFNAADSTIHKFDAVHLGVAVALENGLIVPVIRDLDRMGLRQIRETSKAIIDRARGQKLKGEEMTGATFTVSNLGTMGIREFSAIVNPPEVGILAIGGAEKRAVVRGGEIVARSTMTVTLSADHRVVDGAVAAEFLGTLRGLLEEPETMLV